MVRPFRKYEIRCLKGPRLTKHDPLLFIFPVRGVLGSMGPPMEPFKKACFGPEKLFWGLDCRLVQKDWSLGYHTLWPDIWPLLGPQGPQKYMQYLSMKWVFVS